MIPTSTYTIIITRIYVRNDAVTVNNSEKIISLLPRGAQKAKRIHNIYNTYYDRCDGLIIYDGGET